MVVFEQFAPYHRIVATEERIKSYTRIFIIYGIVGNICYAFLPILNYNTCNANKSEHMQKYGISCGLVARYILPFKYDYYPYNIIVIIEEIFVCCLGTSIVMTITMLVCGILTHLTTNLQLLKSMIIEMSEINGKDLELRLKWCVKYHTAIIEYIIRFFSNY